MKELLTAILNTCFINCSCMSNTTLVKKLRELTSGKYSVECVVSGPEKLVFNIGDMVCVTFTMNDRHVIKNIECTNYNRRIKMVA